MAYAEGRFEFLLDEVIHDETGFISHAPQQLFPILGAVAGRQRCSNPGTRVGVILSF
jgi:hypothetical protein